MLTCTGGRALAQANIQMLAPNPVMAGEASFLNPAYLKDTRKFQLNIAPFMAANVHLSNNFVSAGAIIDYLGEGDKFDFGPVNAMMDNLRDNNSVSFHSDFTLFHLNFRVGGAEKPWHVGLSVRQHAHANITFNDDFFRLAYGGNKQFAGRKAVLRPETSAIGYTDVGLALSRTLHIGDLRLTPAIRMRYLLGNAAMYTQTSEVGVYTAPDGGYVEIESTISGHGGGMIDFAKLVDNGELELNDDVAQSFGRGIGFDIGATVEYKNLSLSLASIDNGTIRFKDNAAWKIASLNSTTRWDGYDVVASTENVDFVDSFKPLESLELETTGQDFKTGIGSKISFNGNYGLALKRDRKDNEYYAHNFGLNWIQGFTNRYNASTAPWTSVYYQMNLGNRFALGANINNHRNITDFGGNIGVRFGGLNLGLGTNSFLTAMDRHSSKQADFFFHLGLAF